MCKDCVVNACFVEYHKAQINELSLEVADMAIAPFDPSVRSVCLILLAQLTTAQQSSSHRMDCLVSVSVCQSGHRYL